MIDARNHRQMLNNLLAYYELPADSLEIVEDVQAWCRERSVEESNPFRAAKCFYSPDRFHIVLCAVQTDSMIRSSKALMEYDGFDADVEDLNTDHKYLLHLMLHEIAAFKLQSTVQVERDEWAFGELRKHAAHFSS